MVIFSNTSMAAMLDLPKLCVFIDTLLETSTGDNLRNYHAVINYQCFPEWHINNSTVTSTNNTEFIRETLFEVMFL